LSPKIAPSPSPITAGSWSGAHHSGIFVNGCQTNRLSAAIRSPLCQSRNVVLTQETIERCEIIRGGSTSPVFAFYDLFQRMEVGQQRPPMISPRFIAMSL